MDETRVEKPRWYGKPAAALIAACVIAAPLSAAQPAAAGNLPPLAGTVPAAGAEIIGEQWLTSRTLQLTVATEAFTAPVPVEVTFPSNYGSAGNWPVTYYTAGTNHDETAFRADYNGEAITASYPSIVVSPRGDSGYWSDWFNLGAGGPPKYETFVTSQLVPLIDANFRTIPDRAHRAIMGESMGGYGTLMLAARHPDEFAAAASLSGAPDSNWAAGMAAISASPTLQGAAPDSIYGPRATEEVLWRGHNPTDLAANLGSVDLQVFTGNGILDVSRETGTTDSSGCSVEAGVVRPESLSLHQTLLGLGIPHAWQDIPWGCHSPALFDYEMAQAIQRFQSVFTQPATTPRSFDYSSIESSFTTFGWHITADPGRAPEFIDMKDVTASGLTITGSGTTTITTPSLFKGPKPVTVTVDGIPTSVQPDKNGAITFTVKQGAPDAQQQYTLGAATSRTTSAVVFTR